MKLKVYEPDGMFRIVQVKRPLLGIGGKIWFTQTLQEQHQLHVGIFISEKRELHVWKTRNIRPRRKTVSLGWRYHSRNPMLDEEIFDTIIRVPFLQRQTVV